jgi:glycosyltransferase involved in cell wall biosynthesis
VQCAYPDATLTLVGSGSQEQALRDLVHALELDNVTFAGAVDPKDIWRYYAEADLYVQTPHIDNMPSSVLEAFASGLPVVSTEAGGVPAILTDGVHGLLAAVDDHEAVARHVLLLLQDQRLARRLAMTAYQSTESLVWDRVRGQWVAAYRSLLPETTGHQPATRPI